MKKILVILLCLPLLSSSQSDPIFSEYGEGSSFNKWIEIYNPTSQNINLDNYRYNFCWNGCDDLEWEFSISFDTGHVLLPGQTYLLVHSDANSMLINASNQTTNLFSNGNDVVGIYNISLNTIVDIIGVFDSVEVSGWDVDGTVNATKDHTMYRKTNICNGNMGNWGLSDGSSLACEWILGSIDDFTDLNTHNANCGSTSYNEVLEPFKRNVVKIIDVLGRKQIKSNQFLLYIYDDGTVEKRIIVY